MKSVIALGLLLPAFSINAATITSTWTGAGSGTQSWETDANWSSAVYPDNAADAYLADIGDATGSRTIETAGAITVSRLKISQTSVGGINTLKLGGDLNVADNFGTAADNAFDNSTSDATKLVIDLAGHNLTFQGTAGAGISQAQYYTLTGGGIFQVDQFYNVANPSHIVVGDNVTVKVVAAQFQATFLTEWSDSATFHYAVDSTSQVPITAGWGGNPAAYGYGNLIIGDANNTVASSASLVSAYSNGVHVRGDLDILTYVGAGGASSKMTIGAGTLFVGGNFTDEGTDSTTYGTGTIFFNGGIATEKTLSTGRAGLTTNFQVGQIVQAGLTEGNIALGKDLATTGSFTVLKDSRLNVDVFTLDAGSVDLQSLGLDLPTVAFTFGQSEAGLIDTSGQLSLTLATINVTYDGNGWTNGTDLTLFQFGSLVGVPALTVNTFGGFTYDSVIVGANSIYLDNVQIVPEPGTAGLVLVAVGLLLYRRKKAGRLAIQE